MHIDGVDLKRRGCMKIKLRLLGALMLSTLMPPVFAQTEGGMAENAGYSSWNIQALYGNDFQEPFNPKDVSKAILTMENSAGWSWGSSFFSLTSCSPPAMTTMPPDIR